MLLSEYATVTWNSRNKKYYTDLGYVFTKMRDRFEVSVDDLTRGSYARVKVKCDYCGATYEMFWQTYVVLKEKRIIKLDCCGNTECVERKAIASRRIKYGPNGLCDATIEKRRQTNLKKYGVESPFSADIIKDKIIKTNIERYGVPYTQQNPNVRRKTNETCRKRYGVDNYVELFKGRFIKENSPCWKGGVGYHRVERSTFEYATWRRLVFERDKYTCQKCGAKNKKGLAAVSLNAHHIKNWKDNEALRYNTENGITLCDNCHREFHRKYGKRNNTFSQLDAFLKSDEKIC